MTDTKLQDFGMASEAHYPDLAFFTPAVKPTLHRLDSFEDYNRTQGGSVKTQLGPRETAFIADQDSFYVAAIGQDRWPYTQRHRGPKSFLCVLDATILGFASMASNRRYISPGNALLFLIDHVLQARLKIWADAEVSEDLAMIEKLLESRAHTPARYLAFLFHVRAFSWNYKKRSLQRSEHEAGTTEPVRTDKADPLQPRGWIEQKQRLLDPTYFGRGITNPNWTHISKMRERALSRSCPAQNPAKLQ